MGQNEPRPTETMTAYRSSAINLRTHTVLRHRQASQQHSGMFMQLQSLQGTRTSQAPQAAPHGGEDRSQTWARMPHTFTATAPRRTNPMQYTNFQPTPVFSSDPPLGSLTGDNATERISPAPATQFDCLIRARPSQAAASSRTAEGG